MNITPTGRRVRALSGVIAIVLTGLLVPAPAHADQAVGGAGVSTSTAWNDIDEAVARRKVRMAADRVSR